RIQTSPTSGHITFSGTNDPFSDGCGALVKMFTRFQTANLVEDSNQEIYYPGGLKED
ncbi:hypothetical protein BgiBS90_013597, partial [Biomphalaria glabrata]